MLSVIRPIVIATAQCIQRSMPSMCFHVLSMPTVRALLYVVALYSCSGMAKTLARVRAVVLVGYIWHASTLGSGYDEFVAKRQQGSTNISSDIDLSRASLSIHLVDV